MTKKKGPKQDYFINGKKILSLRYNRSSSGNVIALRNEEGYNLHLTIHHKDSEFISHIVYENKKKGEYYRSPDKVFNIKDFLEYLKKEFSEISLQSYEEDEKGYTFTEDYLESIVGTHTSESDQEIDVLSVFQLISSEPDYSNPEQFHYIKISRIREMSTLGFINIETKPKIIIPFFKEKMFVLPDDSIGKIVEIIENGLGVNRFLEEIRKQLIQKKTIIKD